MKIDDAKIGMRFLAQIKDDSGKVNWHPSPRELHLAEISPAKTYVRVEHSQGLDYWLKPEQIDILEILAPKEPTERSQHAQANES